VSAPNPTAAAFQKLERLTLPEARELAAKYRAWLKAKIERELDEDEAREAEREPGGVR
jgi:hypothetical protein